MPSKTRPLQRRSYCRCSRKFPPIIGERRVASKRASVAECALADAWGQYFYGVGERPSESDQENAAHLRDQARSRVPYRDRDGGG